jgi:hypothetical protein
VCLYLGWFRIAPDKEMGGVGRRNSRVGDQVEMQIDGKNPRNPPLA